MAAIGQKGEYPWSVDDINLSRYTALGRIGDVVLGLRVSFLH